MVTGAPVARTLQSKVSGVGEGFPRRRISPSLSAVGTICRSGQRGRPAGPVRPAGGDGGCGRDPGVDGDRPARQRWVEPRMAPRTWTDLRHPAEQPLARLHREQPPGLG